MGEAGGEVDWVVLAPPAGQARRVIANVRLGVKVAEHAELFKPHVPFGPHTACVAPDDLHLGIGTGGRIALTNASGMGADGVDGPRAMRAETRAVRGAPARVAP
jgi:hypothetical protein